MRIAFIFVFILSIHPSTAAASDIASSAIRGGGSITDGGSFELGMSVYVINQMDVRQDDSGSALLVSGMYQYKGMFFEIVHHSQDGVNLGVNLWSSEDWSIDLLLANLQGSWSRPNVDPSTLDEVGRNAYLLSEDSFYIGAGFRATRYWGDSYVFQYRLVSDYYDDQGIHSSARLGKSWQVRNLNFNVLGSVGYSSATLNRYLFGVSKEEATELFPEYHPSSSFSYGMELGVAYPLSESFVFRTMYRLNLLSKEVTDSPFNQAGYASYFNVSISYVF
ncbi:MipA/OmpV family protein [Shewanella frigidimarina]|uniref:MipA/OmpV family protein n=1 Tax=Shewanella frigidimarina TaxID=56812 RepID=UPI00316D1951